MAKGGAEPAQQQGGGGGGDGSLDFLWITAGIIIAVMLIWHYEKTYIIRFINALRSFEIEAIRIGFDYWVKFIPIAEQFRIHLSYPDYQLLDTWKLFTASSSPTTSFAVVVALSTYVGNFLRYPVIIILVLSAVYIFKTSSVQRFKNFFDMKQLRNLEQHNWPQIAPIAHLDLVKVELDKGPWAVALSPMRFCKKHKLLKEEKDTIGRPILTVLRGPTYRVLSLQLGARWEGYLNRLPKHTRALLAIFIARINDDKKSADKLIEQLAGSAAAGSINYNGVRTLIMKHVNAKPVIKILSMHAYVLTMMASLLNASREAGVLATSEFLWLKPVDRDLWYMLNSVGRPTATAEICGTYAHWLAEKKLGIPLTIPMIDEAVNGLEMSIKEILYKPED